MLRVVFSFTVKRVLEHGYRHVGHRIVERLVWIEPIKLYTRTHCETVAPFNYFTSTGICQPRYQLSVTRVTRVIAVPSFLSFFPSLSLSLSISFSLSLFHRFMSSSVRWQRFIIAIASTFVRQIGRERKRDTERGVSQIDRVAYLSFLFSSSSSSSCSCCKLAPRANRRSCFVVTHHPYNRLFRHRIPRDRRRVNRTLIIAL